MLITVDCLRYDYAVKHMCFVRRFFERYGTVFEKVFAHGPGTTVSFPAILTSSYPLMYGGYPYLSKYRVLLSEVLRKYGFITVGLVPNPYLSSTFGYSRGHTIYFNYMDSGFWVLGRVKPYFRIPKFVPTMFLKNVLYGRLPYVKAPFLTEHAMRILKSIVSSSLNRGFYLWLHYMDAHMPYAPSTKSLKAYGINMFDVRRLNRKPGLSKCDESLLKTAYASCVFDVDMSIKRLVEFLEDVKLLDETLVIITSDHGEELLETGDYGHHPKLTARLLHVPLFVYPRLTEKSRVDTLKGQIDLAPSILKILGLSVKVSRWHGKPTLLTLKGNDFIIAECGHTRKSEFVKRHEIQYALITERYKFVYWPNKNKMELYDLTRDPLEINNVAAENADLVASFLKLVNEHIRFERTADIREKIKRVRIKGRIRRK